MRLSFLVLMLAAMAPAVRASGDPAQIALDAADAGVDAGFGQAVAGAPGLVAIGANGQVTLWLHQNESWERSADLEPPATAADDFGIAVAAGPDTVIVGAPLDATKGAAAGAIHIFQRSAGKWAPARLIAGDGKAGDHFGAAIALSGAMAVVGAPSHESDKTPGGAAYLVPVATSLQPVTRLRPAAAHSGDRFGESVAIAATVVVVGAPQDDDRGEGAGAAYVFEPSDGAWKQVAKLTADDSRAGDRFGAAVAIAGDTILVGAPHADRDGAQAGAVYLFERSPSGWRPLAELAPTGRDPGGTFGASLAASGNVAVVGAPLDDSAGSRAGAVHLFVRDKAWLWTRKATAGDATRGAGFGTVVALTDRAVVASAPLAPGKNDTIGVVYVLGLPEAAKPIFETIPATPTAVAPTATRPAPTTAAAIPTATAARRTATPTRPRPTATRAAAATPTSEAPRCGNGVVDPGEDCDPKAGPCCTSSCAIAANGQSCGSGENLICLAGRCGSEVVPLERPPPRYPSRASRGNIQGTVRLRFTVTAQGTTDNIEIISAEPRRYFESAAEEAVRKYRYQPRTENGVPVARPGVEVRLDFQLAR